MIASHALQFGFSVKMSFICDDKLFSMFRENWSKVFHILNPYLCLHKIR
jgi:hypothetical protein